jgi:hypothetical protein
VKELFLCVEHTVKVTFIVFLILLGITLHQGDMPDIEVSLQDILTPLLALSSLDSTIARLLFVSMVSPLLETVMGINLHCFYYSHQHLVLIDRDSNLMQILSSFLSHHMVKTFQNSVFFSPPFMAAMFSLCLSQKGNLNLPPNLVAETRC